MEQGGYNDDGRQHVRIRIPPPNNPTNDDADDEHIDDDRTGEFQWPCWARRAIAPAISHHLQTSGASIQAATLELRYQLWPQRFLDASVCDPPWFPRCTQPPLPLTQRSPEAHPLAISASRAHRAPLTIIIPATSDQHDHSSPATHPSFASPATSRCIWPA